MKSYKKYVICGRCNGTGKVEYDECNFEGRCKYCKERIWKLESGLKRYKKV